MAEHGLGQRPWDGSQRRLVQDNLNTGAGLGHRGGLADVALDHAEALPCGVSHGLTHLVQVLARAQQEIVEPDDGLFTAQEGFQEVRSNEARNTGDEPGAPLVAQRGHPVVLGAFHASGSMSEGGTGTNAHFGRRMASIASGELER